MRPVGLLLCGGQGRRMGGDKPFRTLAGQPLYSYPLALLRRYCEAVWAVGVELPGCPWVRDPEEGQGPLAGLQAGLQAAGDSWCLCLAVDMPWVQPGVVEFLLSLGEEAVRSAGSHDAQAPVRAVVPRLATGPEPMLALYHSSLAPQLREARALGQRRAVAWVENLREVAWVGEEVLRPLDPSLISFTNLNTAEDLARSQDLRPDQSFFTLP